MQLGSFSRGKRAQCEPGAMVPSSIFDPQQHGAAAVMKRFISVCDESAFSLLGRTARAALAKSTSHASTSARALSFCRTRSSPGFHVPKWPYCEGSGSRSKSDGAPAATRTR